LNRLLFSHGVSAPFSQRAGDFRKSSTNEFRKLKLGNKLKDWRFCPATKGNQIGSASASAAIEDF